MDKRKMLVIYSAADILKYSALSGTVAAVGAVLVSFISSAMLNGTDAPELYFEAVSWSSIATGGVAGGLLNGVLEKGRNKYSGIFTGIFAALLMLVVSASFGGFGDESFEPLKVLLCILSCFFGGIAVSSGMKPGISKSLKRGKNPVYRPNRGVR